MRRGRKGWISGPRLCDMSKTKINKNYILIYSAAFALLSIAVFFPFLKAGRSFVGKGDGLSQYVLQLRYMGEWLRECVSNIAHGNFALRTYDFTIGMGDDINAVVRFHPLDFLSVFVPAAYTEQLYAFLIFLRLYLAGIAFSLYAFYWRRKGGAVLAGCLTYLFCGYVFELGIVHPTYLSPMIVLPLLFLGAEYMMDRTGKHSFLLFTVMVCMGFLSNYYFMYINTVALPVYVLIRFFSGEAQNRLRELISLFFRMVAAYVTGLLMSGIILLPALSRYFNSYRSVRLSGHENLFYYEDFRRYFAWFINLISPLEASGNGTHLNFQVLVLPAIVVLVLAGRGKWKSLKKILFVLLMFLLLPLGGYIMAVMHTENNRWVYLISLAAGVCVTFCADAFLRLSALQKRVLVIVTVLFDIAVAALSVFDSPNVYHLLAAAELTLFTAGVLYAGRLLSGKRAAAGSGELSPGGGDGSGRGEGLERGSIRLVLFVTVVSTILNGYFTFGGRFGNLTRYYAKSGTTQTFFSDSAYANYLRIPQAQEDTLWETGFYRVDGIWTKSSEDNASVQLHYPGVQIYNSVLNASQVGYLLDTQNTGLTTLLHIHSLDGRTAAEALAGVKYFQTSGKYRAQIPYGFTKMVWSGENKEIWENEFPLSFGFTTDLLVKRSDFEALSAPAKDMIMLHAAILEDQDAELLKESSGMGSSDGTEETACITSEELQLPEEGARLKRTTDGYRVKKKNASIKLSYQRKAGYEILLALEGLKPDGFSSRLKVKASGISKTIMLLSDKQTYTTGREDYIVSLGYADEDKTDTLKLTLKTKGNYALDAVRIYYMPADEYQKQIQSLNRSCLENVIFEADTVTGTIDLDENRMMVLQIPWSSGWKAEVNGEDTPLMKTDDCYLGLPLREGANEIRLTYHTPASGAGKAATLSGLLLLAAGVVWRRKRKGRYTVN